jgi:hypothetical protein
MGPDVHPGTVDLHLLDADLATVIRTEVSCVDEPSGAAQE